MNERSQIRWMTLGAVFGSVIFGSLALLLNPVARASFVASQLLMLNFSLCGGCLAGVVVWPIFEWNYHREEKRKEVIE